MNPKDTMKELSRMLEPARGRFAIRLYQGSTKLVEAQALDSGSLFWQLPNHVLINLEGLLGSHTTKLRDFFKQAHARRHYVARAMLGESLPAENDEFGEILRRAYQPSISDMRNGLVADPEPLPLLNRAKLKRRIVEEAQDLFRQEEPVDPNERGTRRFRVDMYPWYVRVKLEFARVMSQASIECTACIGFGPLSLEQQLCLSSILGIGPLGCDMAEPGQESTVARVLVGQTRIVLELLRDVLQGVDVGVSIDEVKKIEKDWIEWFREGRWDPTRGSGSRSRAD